MRHDELILGIDPGNSGGIAAINGSVVLTAKLDGTEADTYEWLRSLFLDDAFAYIEAVHSMPRQGVASSFKFGKSYGYLRGLLVAMEIPFEEVTPQKWQKAMGCLSKGDKRVTRARAQQLFPSLKVTHSIADALLIAEYGRRVRALQSHRDSPKIGGATESSHLPAAPSTTAFG